MMSGSSRSFLEASQSKEVFREGTQGKEGKEVTSREVTSKNFCAVRDRALTLGFVCVQVMNTCLQLAAT